ncbi:iron uptake porin [Leptolyngbya sp. 'hensonii']|uniref:iron uptake porin n=1 Tax=Leptolyngbya sp. 'hensonii' TaxID=1922337 RepID=UPI00209A68BB|nr:iron uptake porin [Leptolyngbya sp. 'hensonii']
MTPALAEQVPELDSASEAEDPMAQVTSVSQLSDVQPTDWAFQSLQSLVERYGCIAGYPNGTYRGGRAMTRYEFAAGLNACMDRINELIASATGTLVQKEDLEALGRLQEEFAMELSTLRGRVDQLEARTATLEAQQFSTTTKLFGQAIIGVQGGDGGSADFFPVDGVKDTRAQSQISAVYNVQLSLFTVFDPRSILFTSLQASNAIGLEGVLLTNMARLSYTGSTNNSVVLSDLTFRHLIGNNFAVVVGPVGVSMVNVFRGVNRIESAGQGPISFFAQRNPILNIGSGQGGVGFDWQITDWASLQAVYSATTPNIPTASNGLFNGGTNFGTQLTLTPVETLDISLNYVNAYSTNGFLGTGIGDDQLTVGRPLNTDAIGGTISWRISPAVTLGGWAGRTFSSVPGLSGGVRTFNWMAFLNFPDLFGDGNLAGIYVGQPPKIDSSDLPAGLNIPSLLALTGGVPGGQPGTSTHVEAFYRIRLSDNISLTPGVLFIFNSNHTTNSDTVTVGALRTTFSF